MKVQELIQILENKFPTVQFYAGFIDKNDGMCIGIYPTGDFEPVIAVGGLENTSYGILPVRLLIHWTDNFYECENQAYLIYNYFFGLSNKGKIRSVKMLDPCPISIGRAENNICEMVIRMNIIYEREVMPNV